MYWCQKLSFNRDALAGMLMVSLTRLSVFLVAGPEANQAVAEVWLWLVTGAQLELPVLALAVQGGTSVSKFWLQRVPVTAKEAGRVLDWLSGLVTVTFHKPETIPVTSSDPLRVVVVVVVRMSGREGGI